MNIRLLPVLLLLILTTCNTAWSAPLTVCVAKFSVSGANNPEELKATIQTLLLSRMAGEKIATVDKPEGADIKISGSYLLSGTVFSLDAVAVNSVGAVINRAFVQGKSPDGLIPAVSTLAKTLSDGIDKALSSTTGMPQTSTQPIDIVIPSRKVAAPILQKSVFKMDGALNGLAVGRTFPDGGRELFVIGNHELRYYRQGVELKQLAEIRYKVYDNVLAVDTAIHANGNATEIYVTIMNGEKLVSQVWTVEGISLKQIAGPLPYFFRSLTVAGGTKKIYAQQISGKDDFYGQVAELVKTGQEYRLTNPIILPKQGNLYNFSIVNGGKGEPNYAIIEQNRFLEFLNQSGDELWKSSEKFGGSETYFTREEAVSQKDTNGEAARQVYLDQRIVIKGNGELLVPKNSESWYMTNKHSYSHSSLYCFAWDGVNLEEKWHTSETDNYLTDFAYDNSTQELLLLEVISKGESIFSSGASRLVIMKMN